MGARTALIIRSMSAAGDIPNANLLRALSPSPVAAHAEKAPGRDLRVAAPARFYAPGMRTIPLTQGKVALFLLHQDLSRPSVAEAPSLHVDTSIVGGPTRDVRLFTPAAPGARLNPSTRQTCSAHGTLSSILGHPRASWSHRDTPPPPDGKTRFPRKTRGEGRK